MLDSYAELLWAEEYFRTRAFSDAWQSCGNKEVFLHTASLLISQYAVFPDVDKVDYEANPPLWLKSATCEQALYLLNLGKDPTQADKKTTLGVASTEGTVFNKSFRADILSPATVRLIKVNGGAISSGAVSSSAVHTGSVAK